MSTGFGQRDRNLTMEYAGEGGQMLWVMDGEGSVNPYFTKSKTETFHTNDYEMLDGYGIFSGHDYLRDWYFVDPDEQSDIIHNTSAGQAWSDIPIDIDALPNKYYKSLENWRRVLTTMEDWKNDPISKALGSEYYTDYPTTRGLHETYNKLKGIASYKRTSEWKEVKEYLWLVDTRKLK